MLVDGIGGLVDGHVSEDIDIGGALASGATCRPTGGDRRLGVQGAMGGGCNECRHGCRHVVDGVGGLVDGVGGLVDREVKLYIDIGEVRP